MSFLDKIKNMVNIEEDGYYPDDVDNGDFMVFGDNYFGRFSNSGELLSETLKILKIVDYFCFFK